MLDAEAWVAIGFVCFLGCAYYYGAHSRIGSILDARAQRIRDELAEAERFRKEAADVLASFESRRAEAERQAADIVDQARAEAEAMAKEAEERMSSFVERRTAQAEAKISNAEVQALAQVRSAAANAATSAAEIVLRKEASNGLADRLIEQGLGEIGRLAN